MKNISKRLFWTVVPARFGPGIRKKYEKITYFGLRFKCPFCHSNLSRLVPQGEKPLVLQEKLVIGGGLRPNWLCPICGSTDRERLLYLYLRHRTRIFTQHARLLHVAPEPKLASIFHAQRHIDYVTCDLCDNSVTVRTDITSLPFTDDSFDAILCNHVLEHVFDDRKAFSELFRVLRPGGWALLTVPISLALEETSEDPTIDTALKREAAFGQPDHVRLYARDFKNRLARAGWTVNTFEWSAEEMDFGGCKNRFGLIENDIIYVAAKPGPGTIEERCPFRQRSLTGSPQIRVPSFRGRVGRAISEP